jgi:acetyl-CoA synthetase
LSATRFAFQGFWSGKIMRRLLKEVASGGLTTGDTTTLEDLSVLAKLCEPKE